MHFNFLYQTLFLTLFSSLLFSQNSKSRITGEKLSSEKKEFPSHMQNSLPSIIKNSRLQMGGTYSYAWIEPHGFPKTQGNLGGALISYEYRPANSFYGGLAANWRQGETSATHLTHRIFDIDVQERLGFSFSTDKNMTKISWFTGVGYRYLGEKRTLSGFSVTYNYNDFYIPVGFVSDSQVNSMFSFGLNLQWKPQVFSTVTIIPLNGACWNIQRQLLNFLAEVPLSFLFENQNLALQFIPFFEIWNDGKTTAAATTGSFLFVPKLKYLFAGVNVNLDYSF